MMNHPEAQRLHEALGAARQHLDDGHTMESGIAIDEAREVAALLVSDTWDIPLLYEKCLHCHLFVELNEAHLSPGNGTAEYVHLAREGDEHIDASHEPRPSGLVAPLDTWLVYGPAEMRARFMRSEENPDGVHVGRPPGPRTLDEIQSRLSVRHFNVLKREGVHTVQQLLALSSNDLLGFRNIGNIEKILDLQNELRSSL